MVSKALLRAYEFETIYDYYEYIEDSLINGQKKQAKELIELMSKEQKKRALEYFDLKRRSFDELPKEIGREAYNLTLNFI